MSAIRAARGFTGRDKIIKFEGCYHGHADGLLVKAGSGAATFGLPDSPGVPKSYARNTLTLPYNDIAALKNMIEKEWRSIACVIIEPVVGNIGCVLPKKGFLETLRKLTKKTRHCSHIRRSDDGFQSVLRRSTGIFRDKAGYDLSRKGHRRRTAGWSIRRQKGDYAHDFP